MADCGTPSEKQAFESTLRRETASVDQKLAAEREQAQAQARNADLLQSNGTLPVSISSIQVHGAKNTRRSFLNPLFQPLVDQSRNTGYTLVEMLDEVSKVVGKLQKFDIFHDQIHVHLSQPQQTDPSTSPTDYDVALRVREKSKVFLKTGTDLGNTEGSAYGTMHLRNLFGGAESLALNASTGTRTRSAYSAEFSTPVLSNPDLRLSFEGLASSTHKPWASHEEAVKGGGAKLNWLSPAGDKYQVGYTGAWRQVTGLGERASPTVRGDAGDSVKSAISYLYTRDRRDNPMLPQSGYLIKSATEIAGWGSLGGDVAFAKNEMEFGGAVPVPVPGVDGFSGVSVGAGFRAGLLYPLPLGWGLDGAKASRVNDRFSLGGPTDVRGFTLGGLGPRDGGDALGGDVFAAGSVNVLVPLPRVGPDSPFRLQLFANGGRSVALQNKAKGREDPLTKALSSRQVWDGVFGATKDLATGLPSLAVGLGLVYAHPVARFELNFSLPLVVRREEEKRKGLSIGVGINFL
ncbi:sorting assembly machinery 50 kDa subunit [Truncatella angustata]|uniref:Sorting assembly machinery 50 kDa subunit n=1 Tax=Truncatella angustata TaxID=152316 RepID=A0A9P8UBK1_9PEZI|nr:sorting assembly machinery 50 kDa subunit [Truncatella angustata]KAH6645035.1 sorting assembly machinery 50 kDa subunit [Truncatella angustata]